MRQSGKFIVDTVSSKPNSGPRIFIPTLASFQYRAAILFTVDITVQKFKYSGFIPNLKDLDGISVTDLFIIISS